MNHHLHNRKTAHWLFLCLAALSFMPRITTAQTYANSQTNGVTGLCLFCGVSNPNNPINSGSLNDYSQFNITAGLLGVTVHQSLIFPASTAGGNDSLIVGIGSANDPLSLNLMAGLTVETFNGGISNGDAARVDPTNFRATDTGRGEIFLKPVAAFDRVRITLSSSLLGLLSSFRLYYAYTHSVAVACSLAPPNPFAYYPLNGNANDSTPHARHGVVNGITFAPDPICDQAAVFDNEFDYIEFPDTTTLPTNAITVAMWVSRQASDVFMYAFPGEGGGDGFAIVVYSGQFGALVTTSGSGRILLIADPLPLDQWRHLVMTYDGAFVRLFVDGQIADSAAATGSIIYSSIDPFFGLGFQNEGGVSIVGKMDEVYIYDYALSNAQVNDFYNSYAYSSGGSGARVVTKAKVPKAQSVTVDLPSLKLYPNPSNGIVYFREANQLKGAAAIVRDLQGRVVYRGVVTNNSLDLSVIPAGTYFIQLLSTDKQIFNSKIIISK
jgi:hypothetical protein